MTLESITANGKKIMLNEIDFINIIYLDDTTMAVSVHTIDSIEHFITQDEELFERLDRETNVDICSEK